MKKIPKTDSPLLYSNAELWSDSTGPDFKIEEHFIHQGLELVAGVDEVGRGPLAGAVVAASVILDPLNLPDGLNDSKKLTPVRRQQLYENIIRTSIVAISSVPQKIIDIINIRQASLLAMRQSCQTLAVQPNILLVDGRDCPSGLACHSQSFIKGDGRSMTIAAASIVAKIVRDRQMAYAAKIYPQYGFEKHKGYGTKAHLEAIEKFGACPLHRKSFSPMNRLL